jgi:hypothetical protein
VPKIAKGSEAACADAQQRIAGEERANKRQRLAVGRVSVDYGDPGGSKGSQLRLSALRNGLGSILVGDVEDPSSPLDRRIVPCIVRTIASQFCLIFSTNDYRDFLYQLYRCESHV